MKRLSRRQVLAAPALAWPALARAEPALPAQPAPTAPGQAVAWPAIMLLDGSTLPPAHWPGRAAVVVFWSLTCPFCRRHNQHVEKLHRALAGRPLTVLGVSRDRDPQAVRRYAQQQSYTFPITLEHAALSALLSRRNLIPLTVTVDRYGRLRQVIPGEMFEEDLLELAELAA